MFLTAQKLNHDYQSVLNKKKRKLLRPTATLSDKPFLLTSCAQNTPNQQNTPAFRASKSAPSLSRHHLTYTPITRRMLQKQQFVSHKNNHLLPMPTISDECPPHNNNNNSNNMSPHPATHAVQASPSPVPHKQILTARSKKRKFSDLQQTHHDTTIATTRSATTAATVTSTAEMTATHDYETPLIPGSVRKKRRLNSSNGNSSCAVRSKNVKTLISAKPAVSNEQRQHVMKRLLNNEFNPSLSLSSTQSLEVNPVAITSTVIAKEAVDIDLDVDICKTTVKPIHATTTTTTTPSSSASDSQKRPEQSPKPQQLSMILDFDTPSQSNSNQHSHRSSHSHSRRMSLDQAQPTTPSQPQQSHKKKRRLSALRDDTHTAAADMVVDLIEHDIHAIHVEVTEPVTDKENIDSTQPNTSTTTTQQAEQPQPQMVSRQKRRKRHSLSSNAIKKRVKQPTKKLFNAFHPPPPLLPLKTDSENSGGNNSKEASPFDVPLSSHNGKTYQRPKCNNHNHNNNGNKQKRNISNNTHKHKHDRKPLKKALSQTEDEVGGTCNSNGNMHQIDIDMNANVNHKHTTQAQSETSINICPLLTKLIEDDRHPSQIAYISYYVLSQVQSKHNVHKQQNILRKLDSFLALLSRAEILLHNDERARLQHIDSVNKELDAVLHKQRDDASLWSDEWRTIHRGKRKRKKSSIARNNKKKNNKASSTSTSSSSSSTTTNTTTQKKKKKKKLKRRVRFCCFDLSTVTTPESGDLDSVKHLQSISRLLVQAAKIGHKLFSIKSKVSLTRKSIAWFLEELTQYAHDLQQACVDTATATTTAAASADLRLRLRVCRYLRQQFGDAYEHRIGYPFSERVAQHLSSLIRFYIKTIWNAAEFIEHATTTTTKHSKHTIKIPKWYTQIGTYSIFGDDESVRDLQDVPSNAEFIPYHAAEITINLQALYLLQNAQLEHASQSLDELMNAFQFMDNPFVFFHEMRQVLQNVNGAMLGSSAAASSTHNKRKLSKNEAEFIKYLQTKWKELKACLRDVQNTKCTQLNFYLPLLDFQQFLNSVQKPPN